MWEKRCELVPAAWFSWLVGGEVNFIVALVREAIAEFVSKRGHSKQGPPTTA